MGIEVAFCEGRENCGPCLVSCILVPSFVCLYFGVS